ncbi:MAG: hypothetical protein JXR84_17115 [Anaerolineae bacterium]|nr:hypothetical protein [Anaerolineae bacterium]
MLPTYKAILRGNRLEWRGDAVNIAKDRAVSVYVTVLDDTVLQTTDAESRGQRMAAALEKLAQLDTCAAITDPVAWERQMRQERALPGREA